VEHIRTVLDSMQDWNKAREQNNSYLSPEHKSDLRVGIPVGIQNAVHYSKFAFVVSCGDFQAIRDIREQC